ncbi:MAG: ureidoglycolate lyase [Robiginitomaculum sp.]|nr:MAG: ureidoglycolate lyase [Robiginitomaculum sp.]
MTDPLTVQPLTRTAFAPFGQVIETDGHTAQSINQGHSMRFGELADLDITRENGAPTLSIFRSKPLPWPLVLHQMERHRLGSQAFIPLSGRNWLLMVAPPGDFVRDQIRAFLATGQQGVNFTAGTWHHFSLALNAVSDFLVIDRSETGVDCEEVTLEPPITIEALL